MSGRTVFGRTADQLVERHLRPGIAGELRASQNLDREQLGLPRHQLHHQLPKRLGFRGSTDVSPLAFLRHINMRHLGLTLDATHASE